VFERSKELSGRPIVAGFTRVTRCSMRAETASGKQGDMMRPVRGSRFRRNPALVVVALAGVATAVAPTPEEAPFLAENDAAMAKMMAAMEIKPSGDADRDFVAMMVPHHQGAIDMAQARAALRPQRAAPAPRPGDRRHPAAGDRRDATGCRRAAATVRVVAGPAVFGRFDRRPGVIASRDAHATGALT
jgi:DUF305 family protein family protein